MALYQQNGKTKTWSDRKNAQKIAAAQGGTVKRQGNGSFVVKLKGSSGGGGNSGGGGGGGKLYRNAKGKTPLFKTRAAAERRASGAKFGVDAKVVKTGSGKFAIKTGRKVTAAQRSRQQDNVDRDDVVGFYVKPPKDIDHQKYRVLKGKYGQGYIVERRDELTGMETEDRTGISELDKNTQKGVGVFDEQKQKADATTGRITEIGNQAAAAQPGDINIDEKVGAFQSQRAGALQNMRDRLDSLDGEATAASIESEAEARIAQMRKERGETAKADVSGLANEDDETSVAKGEAAENLSDAQAEAESGMDWEQVIRNEAKQRADQVRLQTSEEARQLQTAIANAEQENVLEAQSYQNELQNENNRRDANRKRWSQFQQSTAQERDQFAKSILDEKRAWEVGRADMRLARIDSIRERMRSERAAKAEARIENERWQQELAARLRGDDLRLLGTQFQQQGATERALIGAETSRQNTILTESQKTARQIRDLQTRKDINRADRAIRLKELRAKLKSQKRDERIEAKNLGQDVIEDFMGLMGETTGRNEVSADANDPSSFYSDYGGEPMGKDEMFREIRRAYPELSEKRLKKLYTKAVRRRRRRVLG